jgi:CRP-like cAMP-binding protein
MERYGAIRVRSDGAETMSGEEHLSFLNRSEIFGCLSQKELEAVVARGRIEQCGPGAVVFEINDLSDAIYVIKLGVVEICRAKGDDDSMSVVAYLGESDPIGEMAILTGTSRGSLARVPERAEILKIEKAAFMELLGQMPKLSLNLLTILSKRLEDRLRKQRIASRYQHLSGHLRYFDLPTVIQTLASSERTGTLSITEESGRSFAVLYFEAGRIRFARLGSLKREEAFYQLFQSPPQHSFVFQGGAPPAEFEEQDEIVATTMRLLMESVRQTDELRVLKTEFPDPERIFTPQTERFNWDDLDTQYLAEEIWTHMHQGHSIGRIISDISASEYRIYAVLSEMNRCGLAS